MHKALVQTETFARLTTKFQVLNNQRLNAHFNTITEHTIKQYKERQDAMWVVLPVSERDLEAEFAKVRTAIRDALQDQSVDLTDTDQYKRTATKINAELNEGYDYLRKQNIEVWTSKSLEARRCAIRKNKQLENQCSLWCMFNKFPRSHRMTSQKHLMECFSSSTLVSRMSQLMQNEVFDNWYNKELAQDSYKVWMNFVIYSVVLGFVILVFYFAVCRRPATQYTQYYPPNSSPLLTPSPPTGLGMSPGFNPFGRPNDAAGMGGLYGYRR
jgi:hypothetical protein